MLLFLLLFYNSLQVPGWLKVAGRMHPLLLHFPIVLLIVVIVWELIVHTRHNKNALVVTVGDGLLAAAALAAVLTSLMGLFLSKEEGYQQDVLAWHKYAGVFISLFLFAWYALRNTIRKRKVSLAVSAFVSLVLIIITGHQGATITHGEGFLLSPIKSDLEKQPVAFEDAMVFSDVVHPIMQVKCMSCHNSKKAKGELNMETADLLLKGGKSGKLWDSADADLGLLLRRIHLPEDHKKHMPPLGKPALTPQEIAIVYQWIKSGSSFTTKLAELPANDSLRILAAANFNPPQADVFNFAAVEEEKVKKLNNDYRMVNPLAYGSPGLTVEFFSASKYKPEQLKELLQVKEQVVSLNLNKMPVADDELKIIGQMKNLRKLNLSFTNLNGTTIGELSKLKELRQLALSGTRVNATQLQALAGLPKLEQLNVWNTAVQTKEMISLQKRFPQAQVQTGFNGDTIVLQLTPPVIENEEVVISSAIPLKLKHYINGTSIRYTMDGTEPDSLTSPEYKKNVLIDKHCTIKVKAFKPGWTSSTVAQKVFFRSVFRPDSVHLQSAPDKQFPAEGSLTLHDGIKGEINFKDGKWLGYREQPLEATLYFKTPQLVSSFTLSGLVDTKRYIMPPQSIEVWAGDEERTFKLLKKVVPKQPSGHLDAVLSPFDVSFPPGKYKYYKLVVKPVPAMPAWHKHKGEKAWAFVDEVFVN